MAICLKTPYEIEQMRAAGRVVRKIIDHCSEMCVPGTTTREIDDEAGRLIQASGAVGLFKNYPTYRPGEGFPSNLCLSINEVVVHGIAGDRRLKEGDAIGIDCGVKLDGWCGDAASTVRVGKVDAQVEELCQVTEQVLELAIENIRPGRRWSQVARVMERYAKEHGYGVVEEFVGHGIGQQMHEDPKVPNFVSRDLKRQDIELREGLVLAIEPMCTLGKRHVMTLADGWTVVTRDGKPSAHFEHTVAVTAHGATVLTDGA